jgi:hypothetical protein
MTGIKLNRDKSAAVNTSLPWLPVSKYPPPRGAKLLLISRPYGVGTMGNYTPDDGWTHWQGLPHFADEE